MANRTRLTTDLAPTPISHFSAGVRANNIIQVSGQGALDPKTGAVMHLGDVEAQTSATLEAVRSVLENGGGKVSDIVMFRVYLADREYFSAMNRVYERFMAEHAKDAVPPARTTVMVQLPLEGMLVEIDVLAVLEDDDK